MAMIPQIDLKLVITYASANPAPIKVDPRVLPKSEGSGGAAPLPEGLMTYQGPKRPPKRRDPTS